VSDERHREDVAPPVPYNAYKYLDRPPVVHFKKEIFNNAGVTRCGIVYDVHDKNPTRTTAWYSEATCDVCSPT
jgi:hypothetical protein